MAGFNPPSMEQIYAIMVARTSVRVSDSEI